MADSMAAQECVYLRDLLADMGVKQTQPTTLFMDNKGAIALSNDPTAFKQSTFDVAGTSFVTALPTKVCP
eukprot:6193691-Pleurochrysis_carterae.AAC.1